MIDSFLALVPDYGAYVVALAVFLACLALPVPASVLVLTAGSFAAVGDLSIVTLAIGVWCAFILGDQMAFWIAIRAGRPMIERLRSRASIGPVLAKSERLLERRGTMAVFLSHTILSPTCPYITYLSGAGGLGWRKFTCVAIPGAAVWTLVYLGVGYVFASRLEQVATLMQNFLGLILGACVLVGLLWLLRDRWRKSNHKLSNTADQKV